MCRNKIAKTLITVFIFALFASQADAEETLPKEPIVVNGDKVEYFHEKKEVAGSGNISITYKDVVLTCDRILVHLDTRDAEAEGNVKVSQKGAYLSGERIVYNFQTRKGMATSGSLSAAPFYGRGAELDKVANKDEFVLERGYVTTCDLDKPHYRIQSRQVKVYLNDKVIAKHILFFVGDVPVLYLPYYIQSLRGESKTHIIVIPGERSDWGYFLLSAYRYYFSDDSRGDILLDYRTKRGLAEGVNHYYDTDTVGKGAFKFYHTRDHSNLALQKTGEPERTRYRYQFRHKWDMKETDTTAVLEFNKLSDRDAIKDFIYNEYEELGTEPDNYISLITTKEDFTFQFLARKRFDDFNTVVERLPEFKIDILNYRIGKTPFYYQGTAGAVYLNKTFDNTNVFPGQKDLDTFRADTYNQLSYPIRFFRALNTTPFVAARETYYSKGIDRTNLIRNIFSGGVNNSIKFYKIYDVETNFLGLDIHGLRHIVTPSVNYFHTFDPNITPDNLKQIDDIDALDRQNGFGLVLENRLQTKRFEDERMKSVDLATLIVSTDYTFTLRRNSLEIKDDKLNNIDFLLELVPYSYAYIVARMLVDPYNREVRTGSIDLVSDGGDKWALAVSQRYEKQEAGEVSLLTADGMYRINDMWRVRAYERFNVTKRSFEEQEYTVYRDLHCWVAEFIYDIKDNGEYTFWFALRLKAFPEYPVGIRRTYSHPRFGSTSEY